MLLLEEVISSLHEQLDAHPEDMDTRLVLADAYEERGEDKLAWGLRKIVELGKYPGKCLSWERDIYTLGWYNADSSQECPERLEEIQATQWKKVEFHCVLPEKIYRGLKEHTWKEDTDPYSWKPYHSREEAEDSLINSLWLLREK